MRRIILASASPRRKKLLEQLGLKFKVSVSNFEEKIDKKLDPHILAKKLSLGKAKDVAKKFQNAIIIAADTFVTFEGEILGKPNDKKDARRMLKLLSGTAHSIITGFTIMDSDTGRYVSKSVETKVYLKRLTDKEIDSYIKTGEPLDKAGAYGIQEKGAIFVEKIEGDFYNVVGLPIFELSKELKKFNILI